MRVIHILGPTILLAAACSDNASPLKDLASPAVSERVAAPAAAGSAQIRSAPATSFWGTQKLIRTAELRIQVRDVPAALRLTDSIAQSQQTLLADSRTSQDADGKRTAEVSLRVPSSQFASLLQTLRGLGSLQSESMGARDVTKEYADLETRLAVKEQTVTRLRSLFDTRTAKLAEVLEVERELGRAVTELEQMKGERRYLDQQVALSTVRLILFERLPSQTSQVTKPIADALHSAMQVLANSIGTIIYFVVALLPWILVAITIVWSVKPLRRRLFPSHSGRVPADTEGDGNASASGT
ncbi:MAG TPA: DUF4349 domain-containing protein [Gemmatimonadaceae bacterium]|nr:DUF4349 domain-containing protein [Gemmatimonadaceae bacterium]